MKGALRTHIMRKRQRLKQELEQDAIEKRMRKEKELKRIQDAMTLDQIKEQLSVLEKKLESLKNEKHTLFVQLKQVLSDGNNKRKQDDSEAQKKQKTDMESNPPQAQSSQQPTTSNSNLATNSKNHQSPNQIVISQNIPKHSDGYKSQQGLQMQPGHQPSIVLSQRIAPAQRMDTQHSNQPVGFPIRSLVSTKPNHMDLNQFNNHKQSQIITSNMSLVGQTNSFRNIRPSMPEFVPTNPFDLSHQTLLHGSGQRLPTNMMLMDIPNSLASLQQQQHDLNTINHGEKRPLNLANLNGHQLDDRSRKRTNNFPIYPSHLNPFLLNGLPHSLPPNLAHLHLLNQANLLNPQDRQETSMPVSSAIPSNLNHLNQKSSAFPLATSFDYHSLSNQNKSNGIFVPNFNSYNPSLQSQPSPLTSSPFQMPPNSAYSNPMIDADLRGFNPIHHQLAQQLSNTSNYNNSQMLHSDQAARLFAANMANFSRKSSPKNPYHDNK